MKNRRQEREGGAVSPCVCLCFSSSIIYPALPRQQAGLPGLWGAATSTELILRISPSALTRCMFKQIPLRFIRSGFISARACLISLAYLHGCNGLFGPMEIRLIVFTMGDVCVCVCVCVQVNVLKHYRCASTSCGFSPVKDTDLSATWIVKIYHKNR